MKRVPTKYIFHGNEYKEEQIPEIFRYSSPEIPDDCEFIISPSMISMFFNYPKVWYERCFLGKEGDLPNTSMVLGTICHHIYDCVNKGVSINKEEINTQLDEYALLVKSDDLDTDLIKSLYPEITGVVVNNYILTRNKTTTEVPVYAKVNKGVYVAGTCDRLEDGMIVDFKTVKTKPSSTDPFPFHYKIQLLAYYYMFDRKGYDINHLRLVYGIRPTKTLPARIELVESHIEYPEIKMINDTLNLIADTYYTVKDNPDLTYLIFKSYDLKGVKHDRS